MSALQSLPENLSLLSPVGFRFLLNNRPLVQYFCQAANVPGISIGTIPHATPLKTYPIGGDEVTFEELSIRFLIDENMKNWLSIYDWIIGLGFPTKEGQEKYAKDVKSIAAIINAYYDVVSGSSNEPWEFERDKYIHSENAVITRLDENGIAESHTLEAEYIPIGLSPKEDFYEKELKRKVSKYGNIAQVWSAFEIRTDPNTESNIRGLNSVQLHYENGRWWIDSWTCEMESKKNNLVTEFLNKE